MIGRSYKETASAFYVSCGIWQKSDKGYINGISGNVDIDIAYKNYPEIIKQKGLNGFSKYSTPSTPNYFT